MGSKEIEHHSHLSIACIDMRKLLLYPFSLIYGFVMVIRNWLYDLKIFKSSVFDIPVISVGNLSTGGTGKTPHIEYLIRLLTKHNYNVATLSRGYGRTSKGFRIGNKSSTSPEIGDEPLQFANKFDNVCVAVDERRVRGIKEINYRLPNTDVILLDDAYQHRAVKPGLSILLTDFYHLYNEDYLLPAGNLREPRKYARRADIIVVTKTRKVYSPITRQRLSDSLKPLPHQKLYMSYIRYGEITRAGKNECTLKGGKVANTILMFAGIANTYPFEDHLKSQCVELISLTFPDHHQYTASDLGRIKKTWDDIYTKNKLLITTEKDYMRLRKPDIGELVVNLPLHYIPIETEFHEGDKEAFDEQILNYVKRIKGNR